MKLMAASKMEAVPSANMVPREGGTAWASFKKRAMENPLVPLGCLATAGILGGGLWSFNKGADMLTQQRYMRARVVAQGLTVAAAAIGGIVVLQRQQNLQKKQAEARAAGK